jgi:hypothetical protein
MEKMKTYWINELGIPIDIELMPATYLRNALRLVLKESRDKLSLPSVSSVKFRNSIFFAPLKRRKNWIRWNVLKNIFR